jgi:hypothetical protein
MKKKELLEIVDQKYKKYNDLLWYARKHTDDKLDLLLGPGVKENMERIEAAYPEEVSALKGDTDEITGDYNMMFAEWTHGFNSGCAAAFYYVSTCLDEDIGLEIAEADFPMLDS